MLLWLVYAKYPFISAYESCNGIGEERRGFTKWAFMACIAYDWKANKLITLNLFFTFNIAQRAYRKTKLFVGDKYNEWECSRY